MYCLMIVLVNSVLLVLLHNIKCVYGGYLKSNFKADEVNIQQNLDADDKLVALLAIDICWDLQYYHMIYNKGVPFSHEECQENFIKSPKKLDKMPPMAKEKRKYASGIVYDIAPIEDPGLRRLLVLTPISAAGKYFLPYDLLDNNTKNTSTIDVPTGEYHAWTTLISLDGTHTPWLRRTKEVVKTRSYNIQVKTKHQVLNGSSAISAIVSWNPNDDEDSSVEFRNVCGNDTETRILLVNRTHWELDGLPMDEDCKVVLVDKHDVTHRVYHTPKCSELPACVYYEKAHNLSLTAEPGTLGWDVFVSWSFLHQPLFFNVTLKSDLVHRSVLLTGNVTEFIFEDVEDVGYYTVAIAAILKERSAYTSSRAQFPEGSQWRGVGRALGGAWGALACAGALSAAAAVLWRRRRATQLKHIYFPEPMDKQCKESGCTADTEATTSEDSWEMKSERVLLHEVIGEGAFGVVRRGTLAPAGKEVAVKMLKEFPTLDEIRSFRAEMELMKSVGAHPHVVSLVGCCSSRKPFIVAEYCSRGDLLSYLRCSWDVMVSKRNAKYYNNNIESTDYRNDLFKFQLQDEHSKFVVNKLYDLQGICDTDLTTRDLLSFCRQIAMGMEFLASNRLVHRDLAARNVLVSSDRTLKIADFGLSRDVYEENLYKQKGNGKMPMKWMALESLTKRIYTSQSDVWSFGVVMWEVVSVGASPYPGVPPARLPRLLRAGYRMPRPHNCSKQLYEVMVSCWRAHPRERPTFSQLHAHLDELLHSACDHQYLALEPDGDDAPPHVSAHKYVTMYLKNKLGWPRGELYERPLRTVQSNHYSTPPASACKLYDN